MTLARPHKYLDAAVLEEWIEANHPDVFDEWALSEAVEWIDFWDWLADGEDYELFYGFAKWFRQNKL